jgi:hypothetical protein
MVPLILRDTVHTETTGLEILSALPGMAEAKVLGIVNDIDLSYLSRRRNGPRDASVLLIYFGRFFHEILYWDGPWDAFGRVFGMVAPLLIYF